MKTYYSIGSGPAIDEPNGTIKGVSLIKTGNAEGHFDKKGRQEVVDSTTIKQVFEYCVKAGSIKVKIDHGSGVMSTSGWMDNFSLTSDKVIGDFHIYETEPQRPRIFEIARKNPDHMGMSLEFEGQDESDADHSFSRCERVLAVALVSDPAANKSLFSAIPTNDEINKANMDNKQFEELSKKIDALAATNEEQSNIIKMFAKKFEDDEKDDKKELDEDSEKKDDDKSDDKKELDDDPDADDKDKKDDDKKEMEADEKKFARIAEVAAAAAIKTFAAKIGITSVPKAGNVAESKGKEKHFEEFVADLAVKEFSGDQNKARVAILTNKGKHPDAWKSYEASRNVKTA